MQVLIVEDSAVDRHLLTSILEELGHKVDACSNPLDAQALLTSKVYEVLFLDIVMPEQDGYKFLREIRSHEKTAKQHVIFCSSKKTPVEVNYGIKRAGADDYITKPATAESVAQALQKVA
jgi:two-component system chemotaxis response regulator CheY